MPLAVGEGESVQRCCSERSTFVHFGVLTAGNWNESPKERRPFFTISGSDSTRRIAWGKSPDASSSRLRLAVLFVSRVALHTPQ